MNSDLGAFHTIRKDPSYRRLAPKFHDLCWEDQAFECYFRNITSQLYVECPPEGYYECSNAFIYESKHIYIEGEFLPITVVDFGAHESLAPIVGERLQNGAYETVQSSDRLDVIFCKAGSGNYGHFLTECAPRLMNLVGQDLGPLRIHLPGESAGFSNLVLDLCRHCALDVEIRIGPVADLVFLENFIYLSAVSSHNTRKSNTLMMFRNAVLDMYGIVNSRSRRLAVVRSPKEGRWVTNWDEISPFLVREGFEVCHPGRLTIKEQIKIFASADAMFGTLGAGFTNNIWLGQACFALMVDPGLADFFFWDISGQIGQNFHWQFIAPAQRWNEDLSVRDFRIEPEVISTLVGSM